MSTSQNPTENSIRSSGSGTHSALDLVPHLVAPTLPHVLTHQHTLRNEDVVSLQIGSRKCPCSTKKERSPKITERKYHGPTVEGLGEKIFKGKKKEQSLEKSYCVCLGKLKD